MRRQSHTLSALAGFVALTTAACSQIGLEPGGEPLVIGTTDRLTVNESSPAPFDPAAAYDVVSWNVMRSTFQTLLRPPSSGTEPELEAAESCEFTNRRSTQYECTLRKGLSFANGNALTAQDVKYSVERMLDIGHKLGPAGLLAHIDTVEATDDTTITFKLKRPDATFPYKLATPAAAIVDSESYPRKSFLKKAEMHGSGPYVLESFDEETGTTVFSRNEQYKGTLEVQNEGFELRSFDSAQKMEAALRNGDIDLTSRALTPQQVKKLETPADDGIELVESPGQEIRYLVFHTEDPAAGDVAVRRAIAQAVDRKTLVRDVYERTAEPLYSLVPSGLLAHRNSFFNEYGEPDVDAARRTLSTAGVETPVPLTLHYTTDHYGAVTKKEFQELKRQLNATKLFDVDIKGVRWSEYRAEAANGEYQVYGFGWFPDFLDPDNFIAPFFTEDNFLSSPYVNKEIRNRIIPQTRQQADRTATVESYGRAQDVIAKDVPVLPLWQGKQYVAAREDVAGVKRALNAASFIQPWELSHGGM